MADITKSGLVKLDRPEELLVGLKLWLAGEEAANKELEKTLDDNIGKASFSDEWSVMIKKYEEQSDALVFRAELLFGSKPEKLAQVVGSLVDIVELGFLQAKFNKTLQALKEYERIKNTEDMSKSQSLAQDLVQKIQAVRSRLQAQ